MDTVTVTSEQARLNWRNTIDAAYVGNEVVIERYGKPVAVLINFDKWGEIARRVQELELLLLHHRRRTEMLEDPASVVTHEDLEQQLAAKGA